MTVTVKGLPSGARSWRQAVAEQAVGVVVEDGLELAFSLPPGRWVDLDTVTETTVAGLRDAGAVAPGLAGLDAIVAARADSLHAGVTIRAAPATGLVRRDPPGPVALVATSDSTLRPDRGSKRAWRNVIADSWGTRAALTDGVWADVVVAGSRSLLATLEITLDALEPVLGRDPRGQQSQEFFPNDHLIRWLRVRRRTEGAPLTLNLGPVGKL